MVRTFKPQFAPLVEAGTKHQTVRPAPKRMPKPGDPISLRTWTGLPYRSKQRVLRDATVTDVNRICIDDDGVWLYDRNGLAGWSPDHEAFARADGFQTFAEMREWFTKTHGPLPFVGIVIRWD